MEDQGIISDFSDIDSAGRVYLTPDDEVWVTSYTESALNLARDIEPYVDELIPMLEPYKGGEGSFSVDDLGGQLQRVSATIKQLPADGD